MKNSIVRMWFLLVIVNYSSFNCITGKYRLVEFCYQYLLLSGGFAMMLISYINKYGFLMITIITGFLRQLCLEIISPIVIKFKIQVGRLIRSQSHRLKIWHTFKS